MKVFPVRDERGKNERGEVDSLQDEDHHEDDVDDEDNG